jgi:hypothetical protein
MITSEVGYQKVFFIDWVPVDPGYVCPDPITGEFSSFCVCRGVRLVAEPCKKTTPLLKADMPWEDSRISQGTVMHDGGKYRLWYSALSMSFFDKESDTGDYLCYAESEDGYHWVKPKLGVVSLAGSKDNNLVSGDENGPYPGRGTIFVDPTASSEERYKLIYKASVYKKGIESPMRGATSADGIRWKRIPETILEPYHSDTQTTVYWDPHLRQYVGYFRQWWGERRAIARAATEDFRKWPQPTMVLLLDGPGDIPAHDLYTNAHVLYQTRESDELPAGYRHYLSQMDVHFMFPAQYSREKDTIDVHLATSRNGIHWNYFADEPVIPLGEPGSGREGSIYAGCGLVPLGPHEMAIMYAGYPFTHNYDWKTTYPLGTLYWAIWEKDRLVALEAEGEGVFSTPPLILKGRQLVINLRTGPAGDVRVQLRRFGESEIIPGHSFADCDPVRGDQPAAVITWCGKADLGDVQKGRIQVEVRMRSAKLYCFWAE